MTRLNLYRIISNGQGRPFEVLPRRKRGTRRVGEGYEHVRVSVERVRGYRKIRTPVGHFDAKIPEGPRGQGISLITMDPTRRAEHS